MSTAILQEIYVTEYENCMQQPNTTSQQCSDYGMCVINTIPYYPITLGDCTLGNCIQPSGTGASPAAQHDCWQQFVTGQPPTFPGVPVDTSDDDPPTNTDPPFQLPPCDPYFDCKSTKKLGCLLL